MGFANTLLAVFKRIRVISKPFHCTHYLHFAKGNMISEVGAAAINTAFLWGMGGGGWGLLRKSWNRSCKWPEPGGQDSYHNNIFYESFFKFQTGLHSINRKSRENVTRGMFCKYMVRQAPWITRKAKQIRL